ncbi:unnamed protein product, partial [Prorocentrum cordatum]
ARDIFGRCRDREGEAEAEKLLISLDSLELFDDSALMDSGTDSLTAVSFRNSVQSALNLKMPASLMLDYPTIQEITSHIVEIGGDDGGENEHEEIDMEVDDGLDGMGTMPPAKRKGLDASVVMQTVRDTDWQAALGLKVPSSLLFERPTMREITDRIVALSLEQWSRVGDRWGPAVACGAAVDVEEQEQEANEQDR